MKETSISLLALLALFLLKVVFADERSLPFHPTINETFGLKVGNVSINVNAYPRCGRQGGGEKCLKTGECCSIWGWCGTTSEYCDPKNCQSQCVIPSLPPPPPSPSPPPPPPSPPPPSPSPPPLPPSPYPRCGKQVGGSKCIKIGECCSIWGWCGNTSAYCAPKNCQSQCVIPSPPPPPPSPSPLPLPSPSPPPPPPSTPPPSPSPPPPPLSPYPRCGKQVGGSKCIKTGECCSIWGWCGNTSAYCAPGNCQSQCVIPFPPPPPPSPSPPPPPPSPYPRCGKQVGGSKCIKTGECCSIWGWCGNTSAYCAPKNCQIQCPSPPPAPLPSPSPYPQCGRKVGGAECIKTGECCSIWGWCGTTSAYCAAENCQSQCESTLTSSVNNRMRGIESF